MKRAKKPEDGIFARSMDCWAKPYSMVIRP